nr:PGF-CTERM-anchored ABC transporter substrate-binding protein [Halomarina oriensis]
MGAAAPETAAVSQESTQCSDPFIGTDATGTEVTVDEDPERIVTLGADIAQILWEIDAEEKVVGMPVRSYTAYLNGSDSREDVYTEDGTAVDVESVVALEPDLVVAPAIIPNSTVERLRETGLTVYRTGFPASIDGIYEKTELVGRLVGECEAANETVTEMRDRVEAVETAVEGRERPGVLYVSFGFTAGNGTFVDEVLTTAGGTNLAAEAGVTGFKELNEEVVADTNPEYVVYPSGGSVPEGEPYSSTTAVQQNQTLEVDANYISQAGPRVVIALENVAETLHPEAFENGTETPTERPTGTETSDGEPTTAGDGDPGATATTQPVATDGGATTAETTTSSGTGPGFGVVVALVALVATALLARRD